MTDAVSAVDKRDALAEVVEDYLVDTFGETFVVYKTPTPQQLSGEIIDNMRAPDGRVRSVHVYWIGPSDADAAPGAPGGSLLAQGNRKYGTVDEYRITLHYEYEEGTNSNGQTTYDRFADILQGVNPDGLQRYLDQAPAIETDDQSLILVSPVQAPVTPPVPRALQPSKMDGLRAHFAQFQVTLTDT